MRICDARVSLFIRCMYWFFIFDIIYMVYDFGGTGKQFGLINGNTYDAAVMVLFFPLTYKYMRYMSLPLLIPVFYFQAKTAFVMLLVMSVFWLIENNKKRNALLLSFSFILLAGVYVYLNPNVVRLSGRLEFWARHMDWWLQHKSYIFGVGLGSLEELGTWMPVERNGKFISNYIMHNDFLQILFETGVVGLVLFLLLSVYILLTLRSYWRITAWGFIVMLLTYFPLHTLPTQVLGCLLLLKAFEGDMLWKKQMTLD